MPAVTMEECIRNCTECHRVCLETLLACCLEKRGKHSEAGHIRLMAELAS